MSASSTAIIAAIAAQRRKLIGHFVAAGAVSPERAIAADTLPRVNARMLERLSADKVVCTTPQGRLYVDRQREAELHERRHAIAVKLIAGAVVAVAIAAALAAWLAT